jgi:hypothetical protein
LPDSEVVAKAEDIAASFAEVSGTDQFTVPGNIYEELFSVVGRLGVDLTGGAGTD